MDSGSFYLNQTAGVALMKALGIDQSTPCRKIVVTFEYGAMPRVEIHRELTRHGESYELDKIVEVLEMASWKQK